MMKFFNKMNKHLFITLFVVFLWILVCNLIVQAFLASETMQETIGNIGWTIFLANVLFFIKNNPNTKEALLENALGGIFGLCGAIFFLKFYIWAAYPHVEGGTALMPDLLAKMIPIALFLFLTIALHPMVPYVFNNNAICFFLVALINPLTQGFAVGEHPAIGLLEFPFQHFAGVIVGNLIVNVGTVLIVAFITKQFAKGKKEEPAKE